MGLFPNRDFFFCFHLDPAVVEGNVESAKVIDLIPWMEYEFRIMATNILGTGDPSIPSPKIRTEGSRTYTVTPRLVLLPLLTSKIVLVKHFIQDCTELYLLQNMKEEQPAQSSGTSFCLSPSLVQRVHLPVSSWDAEGCWQKCCSLAVE